MSIFRFSFRREFLLRNENQNVHFFANTILISFLYFFSRFLEQVQNVQNKIRKGFHHQYSELS